MPIEAKDTITFAISLTSIAVSIATFVIVQRHQASQSDAVESRRLMSLSILGQGVEGAREVEEDWYSASPSAVDYKNQLTAKRDAMLIVLQDRLASVDLKTQINRYASHMNSAVELVRQEIVGRYGKRAAVAFDLGIQVQKMEQHEGDLEPNTATLATCENVGMQRKLFMQSLEDGLRKGPRKPATCEWAFLSSFNEFVAPLNNDIVFLGGRKQISGQPKSLDEAQKAISAALWDLQTKWEDRSL